MMSAMTMQAQTPELFEIQEKKYVESALNDAQKVQEWKIKNTKPFIKMYPTENEDMMSMYESELRTQYIQNNMQAYMDAYFGENYASPSSTISVCDNGGFEDDFLNYEGFVGTFSKGSDNCNPNINGQPISWLPVTMPLTNRFQIMSSGIDPLINVQRVKFGDKSLRINNRTGHINACAGDQGIDRIIKTFEVTEENRNFTVWYAVALENPRNIPHVDEQPFLNIKCDKAPLNELCYAADFLQCDKIYNDPCFFDPLDLLDWTCHRFNIPATEIGNIATLEIIVADCGLGGHFGYAYIDGICEECTGSALGAVTLYDDEVTTGLGIQYKSCEGGIARVCGQFNLPTVCGNWVIDSISATPYNITNVSINLENDIICFDVPDFNFGFSDSLILQIVMTFRDINTQTILTTESNLITIYKEKYQTYIYSHIVTECFDNNTTGYISDDYYYVNLSLGNVGSNTWTISRQLTEPYPNESGFHPVTSGMGNADLYLGPYLIQEGSWTLELDFGDCSYELEINPPDYCVACEELLGITIDNVQCGSTPGSWSFDLYIPGNTNTTANVTNLPIASINLGTVNQISSIPYQSCLYIEVSSSELCDDVSLTICPPIPCELDCQLDVTLGNIYCEGTENIYELYTPTIEEGAKYCYNIIEPITQDVLVFNEQIVQNLTAFGPYVDPVIIEVYDDCDNPVCKKEFYVHPLDCVSPMPPGRFSNYEFIDNINESKIIKIFPNPVVNSEFFIESNSLIKDLYIFDINSNVIYYNPEIEGKKSLDLDIPKGLYIIRCVDQDNEMKYLKFIKL